MADLSTPGSSRISERSRRGDLVIGGVLVLIGVMLLLLRLGLTAWDGRWLVWPAILMGFGLARLVESPAGGPYRGVLPITVGIWLLSVQAGWLALDTSWPLLVVALGISVVAGGVRKRRGGAPAAREWHATPLAIVGFWVAIVLAARTPGLGSHVRVGAGGHTLHVATITGESLVRPAPPVRDGDVVTLMGHTRVDFRDAALAPGDRVVLNMFTMWGQTDVHVPAGWVVESGLTQVAGSFKDRRGPQAAAASGDPGGAPRVALRGMVTMGEIVLSN